MEPNTNPEVQHSAKKQNGGIHLVIHADGASRGNPGPSGAGVVIAFPDGTKTTHTRAFKRATNNQAEWQALILALESALKTGGTSGVIYMDSELVVEQIAGNYEVRSDKLRPLWGQARGLLRKLGPNSWRVRHIPREENVEADEASNLAIDQNRPQAAETRPALFSPSTEQVQRLVTLGNHAGFRDLMRLKSGADSFSRLKIETLRAEVGAVEGGQKAVAILRDIFPEPISEAKALRWVLRGLPTFMAARKVETDLEISESCRG